MLRAFIKIVQAEALKQHKNYFHSKLIYFSMLIWPILTFITAYYTYKPFNLSTGTHGISYLTEDNLITFILVGYIAHMFFRSLVQSAWHFSFERVSGTLELIYLTPANRIAFILGNAMSAVFESVWLFIVFCFFILLFFGNIIIPNVLLIFTGIVFLIIPSVIWGMLLNSLFLFSRDTRILFTLLEEPMDLFCGVKIPVRIFPIWAKCISYIFPLTYSIKILRKIFLEGAVLSDLLPLLIITASIALFLLILTIFLLKIGERYAKKTGNMALF